MDVHSERNGRNLVAQGLRVGTQVGLREHHSGGRAALPCQHEFPFEAGEVRTGRRHGSASRFGQMRAGRISPAHSPVTSGISRSISPPLTATKSRKSVIVVWWMLGVSYQLNGIERETGIRPRNARYPAPASVRSSGRSRCRGGRLAASLAGRTRATHDLQRLGEHHEVERAVRVAGSPSSRSVCTTESPRARALAMSSGLRSTPRTVHPSRHAGARGASRRRSRDRARGCLRAPAR
jgi:hypothetical protein